MRHLQTLAPIALLSALLLTGCAPGKVAVPASLLECQHQPGIDDVMDDHALARWLLDTVEAGEDCRAKLRLVRGLVAS
jgi:hypothetical protein